ncbi:MAG: hypothetical protein EAZ19_19415 [Oscillatoriales cyanobacterium]|nr:MAG: hypothetical protein EAZ23_21400 [Oscillatoriales cyanobacterium]TAG91869.1 MAG: hypothetical protein EAZ19_19415 [Oscillatoriales cyanobacterium]
MPFCTQLWFLTRISVNFAAIPLHPQTLVWGLRAFFVRLAVLNLPRAKATGIRAHPKGRQWDIQISL